MQPRCFIEYMLKYVKLYITELETVATSLPYLNHQSLKPT